MYSELISIITPVYNAAQYLPAMLESVKSQTWQCYEHLIIDDCSTDGSIDVIDSYAREDSRIRLFVQDRNGGPARARNRGIIESEGRFIAFLDADDLWMAEKLKTQLHALQNHPDIGLVGTNQVVVNVDGHPIQSREKKFKQCWGEVDLPQYVLDRISLATSSVLLRKECLEACGMFNEVYVPCEDYELWLRIIQKFQVGVLQEKLIAYRVHAENISKNKIAVRTAKLKIFENEVLPKLDMFGNRRCEFQEKMQKSYLSLGKLLVKQGRKKEAEICFEKSLHGEYRDFLIVFKALYWKLINKHFF